MITNFVLGVDLDGVVFDFDRAWIDRYAKAFPEFGEGLGYEAPQKWDEIVDMTHFHSMSQFWDWWYETGGFANVPLYPEVWETLWELVEHGIKVVYITSRPWHREKTMATTIRSLLEAGVPVQGIIHTAHKHSERLDMLLEDNPHTIANMVARRRPEVVTRVDRPWNQPSDYPAVKRLLQQVETVRSLKEYADGVFHRQGRG